jgi:hypothetical protein
MACIFLGSGLFPSLVITYPAEHSGLWGLFLCQVLEKIIHLTERGDRAGSYFSDTENIGRRMFTTQTYYHWV